MTDNTKWIYLKQSGCIGIDLNTGDYSNEETYRNLINFFDWIKDNNKTFPKLKPSVIKLCKPN